MKNNHLSKIGVLLISLLICVSSVSTLHYTKVSATEEKLNGMIYVFGEKDAYKLSGFKYKNPTSKSDIEHKPFGSLSISGEYTKIENHNGFQSFSVSENNISVVYRFDSDNYSKKSNKEDWHLYAKDNAKTINGVKLSKKNKSGAILVQSSFDGEKWCTDEKLTDQFNKKKGSNTTKDLYETNEVQLLSGCYYRIVVAYKTEKKTGSYSIKGHELKSKYSYERVEEVYEFYAENTQKADFDSVVNNHQNSSFEYSEYIGTDKDYYSEREIEVDEPHYGHKIGKFKVTGFTKRDYDATTDTFKFIKTGSDRIAVSFELLENNINKLFGNEDLKINSDIANEKSLELKNIKFKQGMLVVNYTDTTNQKKEPIIYTNFLAACSTTKSNTSIYLVEEGTYDITLDYEILDSDGIDEEFNYKMHFKFEVSNGNSKVYFIDTNTSTFLNNNDITENGFSIDFAASKKLDVNLEYFKYSFNTSSNQVSETSTYNKPAADGDQFTDSGKYVITVTSDTGDNTSTYTIYVAKDKYTLAITNEGYSLEEVNNKLKEGYTIDDDGTMVK